MVNSRNNDRNDRKKEEGLLYIPKENYHYLYSHNIQYVTKHKIIALIKPKNKKVLLLIEFICVVIARYV